MIKIVTRNSKLALWQAEHVAQRLNQAGQTTQLIPISTKGDKILDVQLSKIGSKGVFTEELEQMLASGEADIAVHSAKDLQSSLPDGFEILAFSERERVNDVLVCDQAIDVTAKLTIGTSSTRRVAYLRHSYPQIKIVDMRGNLQTRIKKMRAGDCEVLMLAYAGVYRMGFESLVRHHFPVKDCIPAVGQGSLAVECHSQLPDEIRQVVRAQINDKDTESCLIAERSYLAAMNGGCSIPVFGHCVKTETNQYVLRAGIISLDGKEVLQEEKTSDNPLILGRTMGEDILAKGGDRILAAIRKTLNNQ
ncbi:MAG: hydroxymethylbilane synthase [Cyclobacteriaceae bacterium]